MRLHTETVIAESHNKAKEEAWNNLYRDMSDLWKAILTRRDVKIESENITFSGIYCDYYTANVISE